MERIGDIFNLTAEGAQLDGDQFGRSSEAMLLEPSAIIREKQDIKEKLPDTIEEIDVAPGGNSDTHTTMGSTMGSTVASSSQPSWKSSSQPSWNEKNGRTSRPRYGEHGSPLDQILAGGKLSRSEFQELRNNSLPGINYAEEDLGSRRRSARSTVAKSFTAHSGPTPDEDYFKEGSPGGSITDV